MASILLQATNADDMITKALEHGTLSAAQVRSPEHSDHVYVPIQWSIRVVERSQHFLLLARHFLSLRPSKACCGRVSVMRALCMKFIGTRSRHRQNHQYHQPHA